jgi:predicted amidophosphoribosyltransferase
MNNCCDRCKAKAKFFKMSFFNTDMLCSVCLKKEQTHSEYKRAVEVELEQVKAGNYNYEGIGLPNDLE